jgi:peptidoglycan/LPS O-acetylase OafA/YrhL
VRTIVYAIMPFNQASAKAHQNNFGFLRLVFALLVVVSHSFELVDGNRSREPLTTMFGTLSFGELAVDCFFIISGYLVAKSLAGSGSTGNYLRKRALRIYPGFCVAYLICFAIVAPLADGSFSAVPWSAFIELPARILLLEPPSVRDAFAGLAHPTLDGSMWTIAYEFRCYIILGMVWLFLKQPMQAAFSIVAVSIALFCVHDGRLLRLLIGEPEPLFRLLSIFLTGTAFYVLRDHVHYTNRHAAVAATILAFMLFAKPLAEPAVAIFGGYLIFWFAFLPNTPTLNRINNETDISYGTYLYAWPLQNLIIWFWPTKPNPLIVLTLSWFGAMLAGYLSWIAIERRVLRLKSGTTPIEMPAPLPGQSAKT